MYRIPSWRKKQIPHGMRGKIEQKINEGLEKYQVKNGLNVDKLVNLKFQKTQLQWRLHCTHYPSGWNYSFEELKKWINTVEELKKRKISFGYGFCDPKYQAGYYKFETDWNVIKFKEEIK